MRLNPAFARVFGDRNVLLGLALGAIAVFVMVTASGYALGTARRMGPGYFPMLAGAVLAGFGVLLVLRGLLLGHEPIQGFAMRPALAVLAGAAAFALLLERAGLVVAIAAMIAIAAPACRDLTMRAVIGLAAVLALGSAIVFVLLLGQPIPLAGALAGG